MDQIQRYAVFYAPRAGDFASAAAAWLGWDPVNGTHVPHPEVGVPLDTLTDQPRRYGFHGTLRAPFRPVDGLEYDDLHACMKDLAARLAPVTCDMLQVHDMQGFVALVPNGSEAELNRFAARVVEGTDALRAPLTGDEITRRRPETLTVRQRDLLHGWGYPFVMEEFRFHLTLTRQVPEPQIATVIAAAKAHFGPVLPRPFVIEDLCLFGEDTTGRFHMIDRFALTG